MTGHTSDAPLRPESERPTVVATSGITHVTDPVEELPVSIGRVLHSVVDETVEHLALDVEEPGRPCALSGRVLEPGALCDIVSFIAQAVWRGELVVASEDATRSLFFDEGCVVAAESSASAERLGEVLLRRDILTRDQVSAAAELASAGQHRFGEAAVSLGFITREALFDSMAHQIEEIFSAVVRVDQGTFVFFHGYEEARLSFRRKHEVEALLVSSIANMNDARYFRSRIPADNYVPMRTKGRTEPPRDPLGVYAAIDGSRTVAELAQAVQSTPLEVTRALFQHVQTGHASLKAPRLEAVEVLNVYNKAIQVLLRELDAMDEGDAVRAELATFSAHRADRPEFVDAPAEDGTLDADEIAARIAVLDDPNGATDHLARWLYDYASYALFLARPHLHRRDEGRGQPRVSQRVADILQAIAPGAGVPGLEVPPARGGVLRVTIPAPSQPGSSGTHERAKTTPAAPPSIASTMRMRRVLPEVLPGLDPSRTVRMAPFAVPTAPAPQSMRLVPSQDSVAVLSERRPAASVDPGPVVSSRAPAPVERAMSRARLGVPLLVGAVLVAGAIGWIAHRATATDERTGALAAQARGPLPGPAPEPASAAPPPAPSGMTELVVVCEPSCGAVYIDGKKSVSSADAIAVTAGAHDVAVRRSGYANEYRRVVVADGESRAVTFQLTPLPPGQTK